MICKKEKCSVLRLGRNNALQQYGLGAYQLKSSFVVKDVGALADDRLAICQQCACMAKAANSILGCIRKGVASGLWQVILRASQCKTDMNLRE